MGKLSNASGYASEEKMPSSTSSEASETGDHTCIVEGDSDSRTSLLTPLVSAPFLQTRDVRDPRASSPVILINGIPRLIKQSETCPHAMRRSDWDVKDFVLHGSPIFKNRVSDIYQATDRRSGIKIALKVYKLSFLRDVDKLQVSKEIQLHCDLSHDHIVAMYAAWMDRHLIFMALEWAGGGDLYNFMRKTHAGTGMSERIAVPLILRPFLTGLFHLHDKGLIHRNIKPENIHLSLTSAHEIKITGLGFAIDNRTDPAEHMLGTLDYIAPEVIHASQGRGYDFKADCWSTGVLCYEILVGKAPFSSETAEEIVRNILANQVDYPSSLSEGAMDFMKRLLVTDPSRRMTVEEMLDHPWIVEKHLLGPGLRQCPTSLNRSFLQDGGDFCAYIEGGGGAHNSSLKSGSRKRAAEENIITPPLPKSAVARSLRGHPMIAQ